MLEHVGAARTALAELNLQPEQDGTCRLWPTAVALALRAL